MKKFLLCVFAAFAVLSACDDAAMFPTDVTDRLDDLENRVTSLERLCGELNTNVSSLQSLVSAMQKGDYITNVEVLLENGKEIGYKITFAKGDPIYIYHGEDGQDGKDGAQGPQGEPGKDGVNTGSTPDIGIRQDKDGVWYWTLNGEWLYDDNGNKVKAVGVDGKDGASGQDGATPQLKIEDGYWMVSYDNGQTWTKLCKAVGENGLDGAPGADGADGAPGLPGADGANGAPGADGVTPQLKIEAGKWYVSYDEGTTWTELGQATGADGANGAPGENGVTPQLKIEEDYWYISYDNGQTWTKLGKAKGEDGTAGSATGDSIFKSVTQDEKYVYFTLADGTVLTVQKLAGSGLNIEFSVEQGVAIVPDSSISIDYTITGGDANTLVRVVNTDYSVSAMVKPLTSSTGKIYIYLEGYYFDDEEEEEGEGRDDPYYEEIYGDVTNEDAFNSNLILLISVSDSNGNQITKALHLTEGKISSVSDAYVADAAAGEVSATVNTNVEYDVVVPESASSWLSYAPTKASMRTDYLTFSVQENAGRKFRSALVELKNDMKQTIEYFTIVQRSSIAEEIVEFADPKVKSVCVARFDKNQDGELTYEEISTVTDVEGLFEEQKSIVSFDEFEYFSSVSKIPSLFFANCKNLVSVKLPDSVREIGSRAFEGCVSLESVVIPEGVENDDRYGDYYGYWFSQCTALKTVSLPSTLKYLPYGCFSGCTSLTEISIPEGITAIPSDCFRGCSALKTVNYKTPIEYVGGRAFAGCVLIDEFDLSAVKEIEPLAFSSTGLKTVTIPESVTVIPEGTFAGCTALETVNLHTGVSEIGENAFGCDGNDYYYESTGATCSSLKTIDLTNVKVLGERAFYGSGLTEVTIPKAITKIPSHAFCACESLKTVNLHESLTSIGSYAFGGSETYDYETGNYLIKGCTSLKNVDLPESLLVIYDNAFSYSAIAGELIEGTEVVALNIPEGVSKIAYNAFSGCTNLAAVKMNTSLVPEGYNMFPSTTVVYVPEDAVDTYKASDWGDYTILPYAMMNFTMDLSVASVATTYQDYYLYNNITLTLSADLSQIPDVEEYGIYVQRYDGRYVERYPVDALNSETVITCYLDNDWYNYDYTAFVATADVTVGAYLMLSDGSYIYYDQRAMQFVYDSKPQVKFLNAEITSAESGEVRFEAEYTVDGAKWLYDFSSNWNGDGYMYNSSYDRSDGTKSMSQSWYTDGEVSVSCNVWFSYSLNNSNEELTSNYLVLSVDAEGNASIQISDTMPAAAE